MGKLLIIFCTGVPLNRADLSQVCTFLSATYHTISCHSYAVYEKFLALDVASVSLAIYAIFISGIYYREETPAMVLPPAWFTSWGRQDEICSNIEN